LAGEVVVEEDVGEGGAGELTGPAGARAERACGNAQLFREFAPAGEFWVVMSLEGVDGVGASREDGDALTCGGAGSQHLMEYGEVALVREENRASLLVGGLDGVMAVREERRDVRDVGGATVRLS